VFSPGSLALVAARAGFGPIAIERLREPSGKFTLRAFLVPGWLLTNSIPSPSELNSPGQAMPELNSDANANGASPSSGVPSRS